MAKKTLALALLLLSACVLSAAKPGFGLEILSSASWSRIENVASFSLNSGCGLSLHLNTGSKTEITVSAGAEKAHSILNLNRFASAGDYGAVYLKLGALGGFFGINAGVQLFVPQAFGSGIIPAFAADISLFREAGLGDGLVLRLGAGASVALGKSFSSYGLGLCVMGLWRAE